MSTPHSDHPNAPVAPAAAPAAGHGAGIDPRGPRFSAAITAVLLLVVVFLALVGASTAALVRSEERRVGKECPV